MTEKVLRHRISADLKILSNPLWAGDRITTLLNESQRWLQPLLIKMGSKNWLADYGAVATDSSFLGVATSYTTPPTDRLMDAPIEFVSHPSYTRPAREIELEDWNDIISNGVLSPSVDSPRFLLYGEKIWIYPKVTNLTQCTMYYHKKVTDLVYDNDSTDSEIPSEKQIILIERVEAQIIAMEGDEKLSEAKQAMIDKEIMEKFQLVKQLTAREESNTE